MPDEQPSPRIATAWMLLGLVTAFSYAAQRLWAAASPTDNLDASIVQATHIPYYWRCGTALFHGAVVAVLAGWGLREREAARLLSWGPWLVGACIVPSAIAMLVVP